MLVAFRYVSDGGVNEGGLLVDDITVGGTVVSDGSSLAPFDSASEVNPTEVANWNVRLVGIDDGQRTNVLPDEFDGRITFRLTPAQRNRYGPYRRSWPSWPTTSRPSRCSSTRRTR